MSGFGGEQLSPPSGGRFSYFLAERFGPGGRQGRKQTRKNRGDAPVLPHVGLGAGPGAIPRGLGPSPRRQPWRPVGRHNPPLRIRRRGPEPLCTGSGSRLPVDAVLPSAGPQVTARSPSTERPATATRPRTTRRSSPTTPSSTRTPWASRARWVSRRECCGVLLPASAPPPAPQRMPNLQQIGEKRTCKGIFRNN